MGLGILASATLPPRSGAEQRKKLVARAARLALDRFAPLSEPADFTDDELAFTIELFPGAEPVSFSVDASGAVELEARTTPVGPGYHQRVCELIRQLGRDLAIEWKDVADETGYYQSGSAEDLRASILGWMRGLADIFIREQPVEGASELAVCMGIDVRFRTPHFARTPFGPRDRAYFERAARDDGAASEFIPWMNPEPDARTLLMGAEELMWCRVLWRPPLGSDGEDELVDAMEAPGARSIERAIELLEKAYALDAGLRFPWREWRELYDLVDREPPEHVRSRAQNASGPLVGYRRGDVCQSSHPGVSLTIPGSFATAWTDGTFIGGDGQRSVHVSVYEHPDGPPPRSPRVALERPWTSFLEHLENKEFLREATWEGDGVAARAVFQDDENEGEEMFVGHAIIARVDRFVHATVTFADQDQLEWAEGILRSIEVGEVPTVE